MGWRLLAITPYANRTDYGSQPEIPQSQSPQMLLDLLCCCRKASEMFIVGQGDNAQIQYVVDQ